MPLQPGKRKAQQGSVTWASLSETRSRSEGRDHAPRDCRDVFWLVVGQLGNLAAAQRNSFSRVSTRTTNHRNERHQTFSRKWDDRL